MYITQNSSVPMSPVQIGQLQTAQSAGGLKTPQILPPQMPQLTSLQAGGDQNIVNQVLGFAMSVINSLVGLITQLLGGGASGSGLTPSSEGASIIPRAGAEMLAPGAGAGTGAANAESSKGSSGYLGKIVDLVGSFFGGGAGKSSAGAAGSAGSGWLDKIAGLFSSGGSGGGIVDTIGSFFGSFF